MRKLTLTLSGLLLGMAMACGGGSGGSSAATASAAPAKGLSYTDPAGTGWRLVRDAASTPTRTILDLVGPAGTLSRGVGFNLQASAGVHFGTFTETGYPIRDAGVYELLSKYPTYYLEPKLLAGGVKPGNILTVGIFQKDRRLNPKDSGSTLCQIALELDSAVAVNSGDTLTLSVPKARIIPGDIGGSSAFPAWASNAEYYDAQSKAHAIPVSIAIGTLVAQ
jgi:hypothetical protein